jgi:hypothetical protein
MKQTECQLLNCHESLSFFVSPWQSSAVNYSAKIVWAGFSSPLISSIVNDCVVRETFRRRRTEDLSCCKPCLVDLFLIN